MQSTRAARLSRRRARGPGGVPTASSPGRAARCRGRRGPSPRCWPRRAPRGRGFRFPRRALRPAGGIHQATANRLGAKARSTLRSWTCRGACSGRWRCRRWPMRCWKWGHRSAWRLSVSLPCCGISLAGPASSSVKGVDLGGVLLRASPLKFYMPIFVFTNL